MRIEDSDLLVDLYRGAGQVPPWQGLLARLTGRGDQAGIIVQGAGGAHVVASGPMPDLAALMRMRYQRVYAGDELGLPGFARLIRVRGDAWMVIAREGGDLPASVSVMLSALAPHLTVAAADYLRHCGDRDAKALSDDLARRLRAGWMVLNAQGVILAADHAAMTILPVLEPVFGQIGGRLGLTGQAAKTLAAALAAFDSGASRDPVAIGLGGGQILLRPYDGPDHAGRKPTALALLRQPSAPQSGAARALAKLAQITPSEAGFALRLADGLSISEAAAAQGLTIETARHYTRQIYAKTGLRGQGDLIGYIENSVIRLL